MTKSWNRFNIIREKLFRPFTWKYAFDYQVDILSNKFRFNGGYNYKEEHEIEKFRSNFFNAHKKFKLLNLVVKHNT